MFSIIIPAHNEEAVIAHCLGAITQGLNPGEAEIIVACNACKDRTAEIARSFPGVTVLETETPGKPNALNMADAAARHFPRIYVDADVRISASTVRKLAMKLRGKRIHAAAPLLAVDLEGRSWPLRAYYAIWTRLPYCTQGMVGSGVYALSRKGRARFKDFPNVLAEDDFIRLLFAPHERCTLEDCDFTIAAPTSFGSLLKLRRRWERSNRQIDANFGPSRANDKRDYGPALRLIARTPALWPAMVVYAFAVLGSRLYAAAQLRFSSNPWEWSRDDTARAALGKGSPPAA